jgi:putative acyl-CoA dehydrogenase
MQASRALRKEPEAGEALLAELERARGLHAALDAAVARAREDVRAITTDPHAEAGARLLVERLALALQAAVLLRAGSPIAEAFCRSRLGGEHGLAMGTLPPDLPFAALVDRALPL